MNKEDIKKALIQCADLEYCDDCPYFNWENRSCSDELKQDALNLITEQEQEIERLKDENKKVYAVRNDLLKENDVLIKTNAELLLLPKQAVKQAKIDMLNELRNRLVVYYPSVISVIDELIKEIEK